MIDSLFCDLALLLGIGVFLEVTLTWDCGSTLLVASQHHTRSEERIILHTCGALSSGSQIAPCFICPVFCLARSQTQRIRVKSHPETVVFFFIPIPTMSELLQGPFPHDFAFVYLGGEGSLRWMYLENSAKDLQFLTSICYKCGSAIFLKRH